MNGQSRVRVVYYICAGLGNFSICGSKGKSGLGNVFRTLSISDTSGFQLPLFEKPR